MHAGTLMGPAEKCRCGYDGKGAHPCHAKRYTCRAPATHRFYNLRPAVLAGVTVKLSALDTWACDPCWEEFIAKMPGRRR